MRFRVVIDGQPVGPAHGTDIDDSGSAGVRATPVSAGPTTAPIPERQFEIEFLDSGVEAFAFTFG